jgi:multiple sugar transport system substrate-binding protein
MATVPLLFTLVAACSPKSAGETGGKPDNKPKEPVTLNVFMGNGLTDEEFARLYAEPVAKKLPHITLVKTKKGQSLDALLAAGEIPDILGYNPFDWFYVVAERKLLLDLRPYIQKHGMNLSRFDPDTISFIQSLGANKEVYAIPHRMNSYALYYNRDIFDKFGVPYPTNGMTWPQVVDLARKVTRTDSGLQYRGLDFNMIRNLGSPYSLQMIDPATNKAIVSDKWRSVFELAQTIYDIPGNKPKDTGWSQYTIADPNSRLAMTPGYNETIFKLIETQRKTGMRWGVVSYPSLTDMPNTNKQLVAESLFITAQSKHIEEAFEALQVLATDDVQLENARNATVSPLKSLQFKEAFGKSLPELKDQDLSGILDTRYAKPAPAHKYNNNVIQALESAWTDVSNKKTDINTALRAAKESADQSIAAAAK